jgi:hypothetical protein
MRLWEGHGTQGLTLSALSRRLGGIRPRLIIVTRGRATGRHPFYSPRIGAALALTQCRYGGAYGAQGVHSRSGGSVPRSPLRHPRLGRRTPLFPSGSWNPGPHFGPAMSKSLARLTGQGPGTATLSCSTEPAGGGTVVAVRTGGEPAAGPSGPGELRRSGSKSALTIPQARTRSRPKSEDRFGAVQPGTPSFTGVETSRT